MKANKLKAILEDVGDDCEIVAGTCEFDSCGKVMEVVVRKVYTEHGDIKEILEIRY